MTQRFDYQKMLDDAADHGWTQRELATRAGLTPETLSRMKADGWNPTPDTWRRLARALRRSLTRYLRTPLD